MTEKRKIKGKISYSEWGPTAGGIGKVRDVFCCGEFVGVQADTGSATLFLSIEPDRDMWMNMDVAFAFKSGKEFEKFIRKCEWVANRVQLEHGREIWELRDNPDDSHRLGNFFQSKP